MDAPELLVVIPSRGRPHNIATLTRAWAETSSGRAHLLVALDDDDPTEPDYPRSTEWTTTVRPCLSFAPRLTAETMAALAPPAPWRAVASWGDDHWPRSAGWDAAMLDALDAMGGGIVYPNDLHRPDGDLPTAPAVSVEIIRALGYLTPPGLTHLYVDNVWMELGRALGRIQWLADVVVEHMHPVAGKAERDPTYDAAGYSEEVWHVDGLAWDHYRDNVLATDVDKARRALGITP